MLEVRSVGAGYDGTRVLDGVTLSLDAGDRVALLGPNAAGKTTLVRVVTGLLEPDAGTVRVKGIDPALDRRAALRDVGVMWDGAPGPDHATPADLLSWARANHAVTADGADHLAAVGLDERRTDPLGTLSHGLRRRVELALAHVGDPDLLLLDEPTAGVDLPLKRDLWEAIRGNEDRGLLVATHDPTEVLAIATRVAILRDGAIPVQLDADHLRDQGVDQAKEQLTDLMGAPDPTSPGEAV